MNKLKKNITAREVALDVLVKVDQEKSYSNLQLNKSIEEADLSREDISLATEIIYGTIQHLTMIDWILSQFLQEKKKTELWVKNLLRLSIYQIWYLDRIPSHAIVNEAVTIAKKRGHQGISGLVNGILRNIIRNKESIKLPTNLSKNEKISLKYSHPEWMVNRFIKDFGEIQAEEICKTNNLPPFHSVRVNILKTNRDTMLQMLREKMGNAEITESPLSEQGIRIKGGGNIAYSKWYEDGLITIQDESSMLVAQVLDPKPGMTVLDALAAPGGKTTHIAEKMGNKGRIIASDIHKHKIKLIETQKNRLGIDIIETILLDARKLNQHYGEEFDRILLDVPCSGLGVIRRKPDLKWTKTEADIKNLTSIQREILDSVSPLLKPGGVLVYSTCTIAPEENQQMVKEFLSANPEFTLDNSLPELLPATINEKIDASEGMLQILPQHFLTDGFFISRLIKAK